LAGSEIDGALTIRMLIQSISYDRGRSSLKARPHFFLDKTEETNECT